MSESPNQLTVTIDDGLSIDDLVRLQGDGFSVLRSAHVGNLSPYNLALAEAGIPLLSVDHTITGVDTNYFPEQVQTQASRDVVAPKGRLVSRTVSRQGVYLDELHIAAVRSASSDAVIFSNTDYLRANAATVGEIVDLAVDVYPEVFTRLALPDGTTMKAPGAAELVGRLGIMQLADEPRAEREAVIMPNILDIMANFVIEALQTERATQYHLSGPDMYRYIGGLLPDLRALYGTLRESASFGRKLPGSLEVRLVTAAQAKFATTVERAPRLDALLQTYEAVQGELSELEQSRRQFFTSAASKDGQIRTAFVDGARRRQASWEKDIAESIAAIPELFIEPGRAGFITQYDAVNEGGVYVPAMNRQRPMAELALISKGLMKFARRLQL